MHFVPAGRKCRRQIFSVVSHCTSCTADVKDLPAIRPEPETVAVLADVPEVEGLEVPELEGLEGLEGLESVRVAGRLEDDEPVVELAHPPSNAHTTPSETAVALFIAPPSMAGSSACPVNPAVPVQPTR